MSVGRPSSCSIPAALVSVASKNKNDHSTIFLRAALFVWLKLHKQDTPGQHMARWGRTRRDGIWRDGIRRYQDGTGQNGTGRGMKEPDRTGQDRTGQDGARQDGKRRHGSLGRHPGFIFLTQWEPRFKRGVAYTGRKHLSWLALSVVYSGNYTTLFRNISNVFIEY